MQAQYIIANRSFITSFLSLLVYCYVDAVALHSLSNNATLCYFGVGSHYFKEVAEVNKHRVTSQLMQA
ncbi:hypothetical protein EB796_006527 [Bugula neritina]|uniref:Uncharacterized protein n=1 Tax=Bugula neritina TaxID=10212 RepID=A0A7J7KAH2_BUGNE|nr:hypothetical protein EB796_006527 [Bugula neritina]